MTVQLFLDLDGVLADFDSHYEAVFGKRPNKVDGTVDWAAVREKGDFFLRMPPMSDMTVLWNGVKHLNPIVLTGVPISVPEAPENKRAWVRKHLGRHVDVWCCRSSEKWRRANEGDILVDDWEKYRDLWIKRGGRWVTHRKAWRTLHDLRNLGVLA